MKYEGIDSNMVEFGDVVSQELTTLIKSNIAFLQNTPPVGHIAPIMIGIPGVPTPDPNIWQLCDGSEITNPNSPLRSIGAQKNYTPNFIDRFIKIGSYGVSGTVGGSHYLSLSHSHGGFTGTHTSPEQVDYSTTTYNVAWDHRHNIVADFTSAIDMQPPYYTVKFFMKIQ